MEGSVVSNDYEEDRSRWRSVREGGRKYKGERGESKEGESGEGEVGGGEWLQVNMICRPRRRGAYKGFFARRGSSVASSATNVACCIKQNFLNLKKYSQQNIFLEFKEIFITFKYLHLRKYLKIKDREKFVRRGKESKRKKERSEKKREKERNKERKEGEFMTHLSMRR